MGVAASAADTAAAATHIAGAVGSLITAKEHKATSSLWAVALVVAAIISVVIVDAFIP